MSKRRWIFVACLTLCGLLMSQVVAPLSAQQKDKDDTKKSEKDEHQIDVNYAKAYVTLMEATLAKYEDTNRKLPNTIRPSVMQTIQENVREARSRLQLIEKNDDTVGSIYLSGAEADLRDSSEALRKAEAANVQFSGTVSQVEVDRMRAEVALAKVRVEKARLLGSETTLANVQFELEQLREEVQELRIFIALLRDRN